MKDQEIQIGCSYRLTEKMGSGILTIKTRKDLLDALELFDKGLIEAIQLDAEQMTRLNAEKEPNNDYRWFLIDGNLTIDVDDFGVCADCWWLDRKIETVHQLQQLFQALKGDFLPYNEK